MRGHGLHDLLLSVMSATLGIQGPCKRRCPTSSNGAWLWEPGKSMASKGDGAQQRDGVATARRQPETLARRRASSVPWGHCRGQRQGMGMALAASLGWPTCETQSSRRCASHAGNAAKEVMNLSLRSAWGVTAPHRLIAGRAFWMVSGAEN